MQASTCTCRIASQTFRYSRMARAPGYFHSTVFTVPSYLTYLTIKGQGADSYRLRDNSSVGCKPSTDEGTGTTL